MSDYTPREWKNRKPVRITLNLSRPGYDARRAVLCTCGWARIFPGLRAANAAIERHMIEGTEACDHAVQILEPEPQDRRTP